MGKKIIMILICLCSLSNVVLAKNISEGIHYGKDEIGRSGKDVSIKWLSDNTTIYVNGDISVQAYINNYVDDNIVWRVNNLDGGKDVVKLQQNGSEAVIYGNKTGRAEIVADSNDGSYSMRHIVVNIMDYPNDSLSCKIIGENMLPIQSKIINGSIKVVQVEVNKNLSSDMEKVSSVDKYLRKLASFGLISVESINSEHNRYEFYTIKVSAFDDIKVELRVDKKDSSYVDIVKKLNNINKYNEIENNENGNENNNEEVLEEDEITENGDNIDNIDIDENILEEDSNDIIINKNDDEQSSIDITQGLESLSVSKGDGSINNPYKIEINNSLTIEEKKGVIEEYVKLLKENMDVEIIEIIETDYEFIYKLRVFNLYKSRLFTKDSINDFYIELIIEKDGKEEYEPIISMLKEEKDDKENLTESDKKEEHDRVNIADGKRDDSKLSTNEPSYEKNSITNLIINSGFIFFGMIFLKRKF